MDPSQKRQGFIPIPSGEPQSWMLSLFTLPVQDQPLSLVLCLGAATLLLSNSLTALVLKHAPPPHKKSQIAVATAALPPPTAELVRHR
jgi:hypothetical protein